ncbi:hypothetical protein O6H91_04G078700 [Diphasiastrum complanatum]|uniref:Uncharacterized protein n=1 Tax=Diphasiastrum complanatum TaxID=34168 RepID=A0ACC2DYA2_DIPCM|nr:hypothetical protein O6H91_04G078700 [Diphasiastrum complanatum]
MVDVSPFAQRFKNVAWIMRENVTKDIRLCIVSGCSRSRMSKQFNAPTSNEIAVLMPLDETPSDGMRDIILHSIQDGLQFITQHHSSYDALHFVLLFPFGTDGWYPRIPHDLEGSHRAITIRKFYCHHLQVCAEHVSPIHLGGRLLQEYACDMMAKMVQNNMNYYYSNQHSFRREIRSGIVDAVGAHSSSNIGTQVVLPSSYIGSSRHMHQQYQDAKAVVRELDSLDLLHVVEFQKRGLPHAHLLIILEDRSKPITVGDYDRIVCAEVPMKEEDPELYEIVRTCMMHGPCGTAFPNAPFIKDGKRRENGVTVRSHGVELDNRWVVPYNRWLTLHFYLKYLYKYVYKGPDMITAGPAEGRANESCWRLLGLSMGAHKPVVTRLAVHLPGQELVYFSEGVDLEEVVDGRSEVDLPRQYWYNKRTCKWTHRINMQTTPTIGRMYFVHPSKGERFYMQVLLAHVKGATSFEDLRTADDELFQSFRDACRHRLLINDTNEWSCCLREAVSWGTPSQLRLMFVVLLLTCVPSDPLELWRSIEPHLVEDYAHELGQPITCETIFAAEKSLVNFKFRVPDVDFGSSPLFREEMFVDENPSEIFDCVVHEHVVRRVGGVFFVDGPGGTDKTHLYSVMLSYVHAQGWIALALASCGIAALLMKGGRTAHSRFKIPPTELNESSTCNISKQSALGALLMACRLIIWDEAPMAPKYAIECVDRSLRDILSIEAPFRRVPVVFGVGRRLKCSRLWKHMEVHKLTKNMRVMGVEGGDKDEQLRFAKFLPSVGDGHEPTFVHRDLDLISLPEGMCNVEFLRSRAILAPLNKDVDEINARVVEQLPGDVFTFYSADSVVECEGSNVHPIEYLNSLQPSGCPPHKLVPKIGMIVMLLRSMASHKGLCNGTRLIILSLGRQVIEVEIVTGKNIRSRVLIPRIPIVPSDSNISFELQRVQFPIRAAFAMTINKAQGQTMDTIGLYLPRPVFSRGQLYVALSRVRNAASLRVLITDKDN